MVSVKCAHLCSLRMYINGPLRKMCSLGALGVALQTMFGIFTVLALLHSCRADLLCYARQHQAVEAEMQQPPWTYHKA